MNKTRHLFMFLVAITFISCKKDIPVPEENFTKLFGVWNWYSTKDGESGDISYAEDSMPLRQREFKSNGVHISRIDGKKVGKGDYVFEQTDSSFIIHFLDTDPDGLSFSFVGNDTLILSLGCSVCHVDTYVREE